MPPNNALNKNWLSSFSKSSWRPHPSKLNNIPTIDRKADVPGLRDKARYCFYYWPAQPSQLGLLSKTPSHCQASLKVSEKNNHLRHCLQK